MFMPFFFFFTQSTKTEQKGSKFLIYHWNVLMGLLKGALNELVNVIFNIGQNRQTQFHRHQQSMENLLSSCQVTLLTSSTSGG